MGNNLRKFCASFCKTVPVTQFWLTLGSLTAYFDSHFQTVYFSGNFLHLSDENICACVQLGKSLFKSSLNITFINSGKIIFHGFDPPQKNKIYQSNKFFHSD